MTKGAGFAACPANCSRISVSSIVRRRPAEQLIIPPAHWEFDVLPCRAGQRQITLYVNMRIEAGAWSGDAGECHPWRSGLMYR
jgi:hypothetical protein